MILVTGGAGFIGSNFVLDWLAAESTPVVNLDKLTYAGNLGNLVSVRRRFTARLRARRHLRPRPRRASSSSSTGRAQSSISPRKATSTARSRVPASSCRPTSSALFALLEEARAYWSGLAAAERASVSASCMSLPTKCTDRSAPTIPRSPKPRRMRPTALMPPRKRGRIISSARITTPTVCRRSRPTAPTTTALTSFPRS